MDTQADIAERLDRALRPFLAARTDLSAASIGPARASLNARRRTDADALETPGVEVTDIAVPGPDGRAIPVRLYRGGPQPAPVVIYCHAGAFVLGNLDTDHRQCVNLAGLGRCTVVSVDYRLAPEHPHPAGLEDAATALRWVVDNAGGLQVDPARLAVAGSSAGGGLAAGLARRAAAGTLPRIVFALLHQPVLDDRPTDSKAAFVTTPGFDGVAAQQMWRHYLAGQQATEDAVPSRQEDLAGLADSMITCSELDPLRDEALDYARRLLAVGVSTELHVIPGTCHGFDSLLPDWHVSRQLTELQGSALRRAFRSDGTD